MSIIERLILLLLMCYLKKKTAVDIWYTQRTHNYIILVTMEQWFSIKIEIISMEAKNMYSIDKSHLLYNDVAAELFW